MKYRAAIFCLILSLISQMGVVYADSNVAKHARYLPFLTLLLDDPIPQANADTATTLIDTAVAINVLANDTDVVGNTISIVQPANGTAVINADNTITYTPNTGFYGADNFTYSVSGKGGSAEAVVYVIVIGPQGTLSWVKHAGFYGEGVATLPDGTAFVTGSFLGSTTFGAGEPNATTLTSAGSRDIFLAKFNPDGSLAFAKRAGGTGDPNNLGADTGLDIAVLADGTSFVVGIYYGTAVFGEGEVNETTLISVGYTDIFIARYNPNGTLAWVRSAGGDGGSDYAPGVAVLSDGSPVLTGKFGRTAVFEPGGPNETTLTTTESVANTNIFIARYNPDGSLAWARKDGATNISSGGNDIGVLPDGSIRVVGEFTGTTTFGAGEINSVTLTSPHIPGGGDYSSGFVAAYNSDGSFAWVRESGKRTNSLALLTDGTMFVTGSFMDSFTFGSGEPNQTLLSSKGGTDIYVARYGLDGLLAWARSAGSSDDLGYEEGRAIATLPDGSSFVTGGFLGTSVFGEAEANETTLTSAEFLDVFVSRYSATGSLVWAKSAQGISTNGYEYGTGIALTADGSPLVTGGIRGAVVFGQGELNETVFNTSSYQMFISRYNP